jgi:hypothetical protein
MRRAVLEGCRAIWAMCLGQLADIDACCAEDQGGGQVRLRILET